MSKTLNYDRINQALSAQISPDELTDAEHEVYLEKFYFLMENLPPRVEESYCNLSKNGTNAGLDEDGNLIYG